MKPLLAKAAAIGALILLTSLIHVAPSAADAWGYNDWGYNGWGYNDWDYNQRYLRPHGRTPYPVGSPEYSACRIGWWRTLDYGHVKPHWAEACR